MGKLSQIFKDIPNVEPPKGLEGLILARINSIECAREKKKLWISSLSLAVSGLASIAAVFFLGKTIVNSEFANMLSLVFSDSAIIIRHWNDFLLSLAETLPVVSIIMILMPIFILLISLNLFFNAYKKYDCENNLKYSN
jgi:hypothetical protein